MTLRSRLLGLALCSLLVAGPAAAQSHSDVAGVVPMSDVSGTLGQGDLVVFQSDEARLRMAELAAALAQALRAGALPAALSGGEPSMEVPAGVADLLLAPSRREGRAAAQRLTDALTAQGVPSAEAGALSGATAGLLAADQVDPQQFVAALHAFNAVVDATPAPVLARPSQEFVVVRAVLLALLPGSAS